MDIKNIELHQVLSIYASQSQWIKDDDNSKWPITSSAGFLSESSPIIRPALLVIIPKDVFSRCENRHCLEKDYVSDDILGTITPGHAFRKWPLKIKFQV